MAPARAGRVTTPDPRAVHELPDDQLADEVDRVIAAAELLDALPMPDKKERADWTVAVLGEATRRAGEGGAALARRFNERLAGTGDAHKAWRQEKWAAQGQLT